VVIQTKILRGNSPSEYSSVFAAMACRMRALVMPQTHIISAMGDEMMYTKWLKLKEG
jgi:hypothetical protein